MKPVRKPEYRIYKPRKTLDGAASKLQLVIKQDEKGFRLPQLFWVGVLQIGVDENKNAKFAWDDENKTVTMKLDDNDIGQILTTFSFITKETKLFHQNPKGSTTLTIHKFETGFNLRLSKKINNNLIEVKHTISPSEAETLKILLQQAIIAFYQW